MDLLDDTDNESSKLATRKWHVIHSQSGIDYGEGNENGTSITFETKNIKSSLCLYSNTYILVTGDTTSTVGDVNINVAFEEKFCSIYKMCNSNKR